MATDILVVMWSRRGGGATKEALTQRCSRVFVREYSWLDNPCCLKLRAYSTKAPPNAAGRL